MDKLRASLSSKAQYREVRGMGFMIAIELKIPTRETLSQLAKNGVLALPAGEQVVRLLPPYTIPRASLDAVAAAITDVVQ